MWTLSFLEYGIYNFHYQLIHLQACTLPVNAIAELDAEVLASSHISIKIVCYLFMQLSISLTGAIDVPA